MVEPTEPIYRREGRAFKRIEGAEQYRQNGRAPFGVDIPRPAIRRVTDLTRDLLYSFQGLLSNSDIAYRRNRTLQRMMRHDPDVMGPLLQRQMAVALLEWDVVAEDQEDETQVEQAKAIKQGIEHSIRRWHDFVRNLQEAVWYGPGACQVMYGVTPDGVYPTGWLPIHSDSIEYNEDGEVGIRVGHRYRGDVVQGIDGRVHMLEADERRAFVVHTFMPQGPDYDEPRQSRYPYAGVGLRDRVWFQWLMKQKALQLWMRFVERYGTGTKIARYPHSDPEALASLETAIQNLQGDQTLMLPNDAESLYDFTILDPQGGNRQNQFADLIEGYLAGQIKELIIGQSATTEATNTGLGSDVATRHAETFHSIIKYDACALGDTLTHDLIGPISSMNYGETTYRPRFAFNVEDVDSEEFMTGLERAQNMGLDIPTRVVRDRLGIDEPKEGEDVLPGRGGGGLGDDDGLFGSGALDFARLRRAVRL